jgi:hypothetical protein
MLGNVVALGADFLAARLHASYPSASSFRRPFMPIVRVALACFMAGLLAACALPAPHSTGSASRDCTDSYTGSRLCDANGSPETGQGFRNPSLGMDMPTHPH